MRLFKSWWFILLCLVLLAAAGVAAASAAGWINVGEALARAHLINTANARGAGGVEAAAYDSLKQENNQLKQQIATLRQQAVLNPAGGLLAATDTGVGVTTQEAGAPQQIDFKDLAGYYGGMKPANAVAILNNQDPQTAAGILHEMDRGQAGQILAAMDPAQAARMIKLIAAIPGGGQAQKNSSETGVSP